MKNVITTRIPIGDKSGKELGSLVFIDGEPHYNPSPFTNNPVSISGGFTLPKDLPTEWGGVTFTRATIDKCNAVTFRGNIRTTERTTEFYLKGTPDIGGYSWETQVWVPDTLPGGGFYVVSGASALVLAIGQAVALVTAFYGGE